MWLMVGMLACTPDYKGSLSLDFSGAEKGGFSTDSADFSGDAALFPATAEEPQFITDLARLRPGLQTPAFSEYRTSDAVYNTGGVGGLEIMVERVRWTGDRNFPFVHEGTITGAIETLEVDGSFVVSESNCLNSVLSIGNTACSGGYFNLGPEEPQIVEISAFGSDDCPAEIRDVYIDGTTIEAFHNRLVFGGATQLDCLAVTRDSTITQGDEKWEGGPFVCGGDTTVQVDGCTWAVTVHATPDGTFNVYGGVVEGDCEPSTCQIVAQGSVVIGGSG